ISFHHFGMQGADFLELLAHRFEPMDQVLGEMSAFAFAHLNQIGKGSVKRALDGGPYLLRAHGMFWKTHHARSLENCADGDLARRIQFLLQGAHRFVVGAGQPGIASVLARIVLTVVESLLAYCTAVGHTVYT